ncbi:hypothetical protein cym2001_00460 [Pseudomonas sp. CYM-20-01]|nr:hypothetical protein cym2001_00460 [Pseudomonas sp. CYM-20-01]
MFVEHALDAIRRHSGQATAGEFGKAVEVEQLVLREQHHQGAYRIFQQHCLDLLRRIQAREVGDFRVGDGEFCEQSPNDRRGGQWGCGEGNF